ncbi:hypothetical protein WAI453_012397 [Rhynchosporium graminicola]
MMLSKEHMSWVEMRCGDGEGEKRPSTIAGPNLSLEVQTRLKREMSISADNFPTSCSNCFVWPRHRAEECSLRMILRSTTLTREPSSCLVLQYASKLHVRICAAKAINNKHFS